MRQRMESALGDSYTVRGRQRAERCEDRCMQKTADRVQICGLREQPWLNGRMARILPDQPSRLRVRVQVEGTSAIKSLPWRAAKRRFFRSGDRVVVTSLQDLDGRLGHVLEDDDGIQRLEHTGDDAGCVGISVILDGEDAPRLVPMSNLQLDIECPVCNLDMQYGYIRLRCEHQFHQVCISRWAASSAHACPLCRQGFSRGALLFEEFPVDLRKVERDWHLDHAKSRFAIGPAAGILDSFKGARALGTLILFGGVMVFIAYAAVRARKRAGPSQAFSVANFELQRVCLFFCRRSATR